MEIKFGKERRKGENRTHTDNRGTYGGRRKGEQTHGDRNGASYQQYSPSNISTIDRRGGTGKDVESRVTKAWSNWRELTGEICFATRKFQRK